LPSCVTLLEINDFLFFLKFHSRNTLGDGYVLLKSVFQTVKSRYKGFHVFKATKSFILKSLDIILKFTKKSRTICFPFNIFQIFKNQTSFIDQTAIRKFMNFIIDR